MIFHTKSHCRSRRAAAQLRLPALGLAALAACLAACSDSGGPRIRNGDLLDVLVVVPTTCGLGLAHAAQDMSEALAIVTGAPYTAGVAFGDHDVDIALASHVIAVMPDPGLSELDAQSYRIRKTDGQEYGGRSGLVVEASSEQGGMYGLYRILADLGVVYLHPEQTFFPRDEGARLPWHYRGEVESPAFALRGFHEHTQHPTPLSDFLLRPGREDFKPYLRRYLRYLARNRQNALSFMLLKTVDREAWIPFMARVASEAHQYGIRVGVSVSFVDQQQNAFKLLDGPDERSDAERIRLGLDELLAAGFDFFIFQIGSSEFTKPADSDVLGWLDAATDHLASRGKQAWAWIHITCSLQDESGGFFFHLPLRADGRLGAFLHTTMFYTLTHPAPVYDCEDFSHQLDFASAAEAQGRPVVFFPESAWWLGFDNNLPLALPITGWSRAHDVQQALAGRELAGHVTFTSGREWTYWQYDHFLTRLSWDVGASWEAYLESLAPLYGAHGDEAVRALKGWTDLQVQHFYEQDPLVYFYLAGELPQDEIGAQAGILARRPKLGFRDLVRYDDAAFAAWEQGDLAMLARMRAEYRELLDGLPAELARGQELSRRLYRELFDALWVYVRRIEHASTLYGGVAAVRRGDEAAASDSLAEARAISAEVTQRLSGMEALYRYPVELLCRDKPESPTAYKYGYLAECSSGFFWTRRDEQLAALIDEVFHAGEQSWQGAEPEAVFFTDRDRISMLEPASELAASAVAGFVPRLLFGLDLEPTGRLTLGLAQDHDGNDLPDPGSEQAVDMEEEAGAFLGCPPVYTLRVHDSAGQEMGELAVLHPEIRLWPVLDGQSIAALERGTLAGQVASEVLVGLVVSVGGIDEAGASALIKAVYGIDAAEPLPAALPFAFEMLFDPV
ncbi:MAG: hypothetical protein JXR96_07435 [Deltaproteobacteria bacterium]|nr:hypothetical protein [Deltaproteobacteria bacterium]